MFDPKYSKQVFNHNEPHYYPEKCTILPFFGYHARLNSVSYTDSYGGDYYVTSQGANTYKVTKSATHYYNRYRDYAEYTRGTNYAYYEPRLDELEEKFYQEYIVKRGVDVWYSPYISPTLEDYHKRYAKPKNANFLAVLGALCIPLAIASVIVIGIMLMDVIESIIPDFLPITSTHISTVPFVILMGIGVLSLVKRRQSIKQLRAIPLENMSQEYREDLRKHYYKSMISIYGKDLGSILQQYSELMESARDKAKRPHTVTSKTRKKKTEKVK